MPGRLLTALMLLALLGACATPPQTAALLGAAPAGFPEPFLIETLPFFPQEDYQCGPAALATVLDASGIGVQPGQLAALVYVPGRRGSFHPEMAVAPRSFGRVGYVLEPSLELLLREVQAGLPVVVLQNLGLSWLPRWHFAVVKGFDPGRGVVLLNSGRNENLEQSLALFERTWARGGHWALVVPAPGQLPATAEPLRWFQAALALEQTGRPAVALQAYEAGLERWPVQPELALAAGNLHYGQGRLEAALSHFAALVAADPEQAPALNNLAQVLFELGRREEALRHARRAVALGGEFAPLYRQTLREIEADTDQVP